MKPLPGPLKNALVRGLALGAGLLVLAYGLVCWMIGSGVDDALSRASRQSPGQGSDALLAMVNSEESPLKERNRAVWALGQLGDSRTVPSLEALLTGRPCDHAAGVCQYELKKAIRQCRGGLNVTRWAWRKFVL